MAAALHTFETLTAPAVLAGGAWPALGTARRVGEPPPAGSWYWAVDPAAGGRAPVDARPIVVGLLGDPWTTELGAFAARGCLAELAARAGADLRIVTGGPALLDQLDLLRAAGNSGRLRVWVRLSSLDGRIAAAVEPGGASPTERLEMIRALAGADLAPGILVPAVPGLNDDAGHLSALLQAAREAGAARAVLAPVDPIGEAWSAAWVRAGRRSFRPPADDVYPAWLALLAAQLRRKHSLAGAADGPTPAARPARPAASRSRRPARPQRFEARPTPQLCLGLRTGDAR